MPRLDPTELRVALRNRVRAAARAKMLAPFFGLPCGVVAVDGKGTGLLEHDGDGDAQRVQPSADDTPYWLGRVQRAVLVSAEAAPCLDQIPIGSRTNETAQFSAFVDELVEHYDSLFEIITADAGCASRANANHVHQHNKAYVFGLKENQPELLKEAQRLLGPRTAEPPDAQEPWYREKGKWVQRRLWRTKEIAGYHGWHHLQQAWLVQRWERDSLDDDAQPRLVETRYYLTSLKIGTLNAEQCLTLVRRHWSIENDCFWSLDTQWGEDSVPWCSKGKAVEILGLLRVMAYNLLQLARRRHMRRRLPDGEREPAPAWRRLFDWVRQALRLPVDQRVLAAT